MATQYPSGIDNNSSLPLVINSVSPIIADDVNRLRNAIIAVETELGINPSGTYGTVRDRLDALLDAISEDVLLIRETAEPSTPDSGFGKIYEKSDGYLYFKNDDGNEYDLTSSGSGLDGYGIANYAAYWSAADNLNYTEQLRFNVTETVFNDDGVDTVNFRLEGGSDPFLIYSKSSTDQLSIGTNSFIGKLTVSGSVGLSEISAPSTPASGFGLMYEKADGYLYFKNDTGNEYNLASNSNAFHQFGNSFTANAILGTNDVFDLSFETSGITRLTIDASGNLVFNNAQNNSSFTARGSATAFDLFLINTTDDEITIRRDSGTGTALKVVAGDVTSGQNAFLVQANLTTSTTGVEFPINSTLGGAAPTAVSVILNAGYVSTATTVGLETENGVAGVAVSSWLASSAQGNLGLRSTADAITVGHNTGIVAGAFNSTTQNVAIHATAQQSSLLNIGVVGQAHNATGTKIGGFFRLVNDGAFTTPTFTADAALMADNTATTENIFVLRDNGTSVFTIADGGDTTFAPAVFTSGAHSAIVLTAAAHTGQTASTEVVDFDINLARTLQHATGALTNQRAMRVQAPTYGFVGSSTITNASTLAISGAPVKGTNATITNTHALLVESGAVSTAVSSYGLTVHAPTGATNNYSAAFLDGYVGINNAAPLSQLHIDTNAVNAAPILTLENTAGNVKIFRSDATPESSVTGSAGDVVLDGYGGNVYIKDSGVATSTGWALIESNDPGVETYISGSTVDIDFKPSLPSLKILDMNHNITFTTSNLSPSRSVSIILNAVGSIRTFTFPAGWIFLGSTAPASLASGKTAVLSLTSKTSTNSGVIVAYSAEP